MGVSWNRVSISSASVLHFFLFVAHILSLVDILICLLNTPLFHIPRQHVVSYSYNTGGKGSIERC